MYQSEKKCPHCRATDLIRTEVTGAYQVGECVNCRLDRSAELPQKDPVENGVVNSDVPKRTNKR